MPYKAIAARTNAVVAIDVSISLAAGVGAFGSPVKVGLANGAFRASMLVIEAAKFGSFPIAAANSLSVSRAAGEDATRSARAFCTKAVLANWVVLVPAAGVGAVGTPVRAGLTSGALRVNAWSI
ncbi:hypothetical protein D3C77_493020 [compost metagenome]